MILIGVGGKGPHPHFFFSNKSRAATKILLVNHYKRTFYWLLAASLWIRETQEKLTHQAF